MAVRTFEFLIVRRVLGLSTNVAARSRSALSVSAGRAFGQPCDNGGTAFTYRPSACQPPVWRLGGGVALWPICCSMTLRSSTRTAQGLFRS
jgi:hypothetical protein